MKTRLTFRQWVGLAGVATILWLTRSTLNVESYMGAIMAVGVAVANAILLVSFAERERAAGATPQAAALTAGRSRLRPILMTTVVLVAAMLPVAFGKGPGAANRATMAVVIVGGQTRCLLITLLITPVAYSLFDELTHWVKEKLARKAA